MSSKLFMVGPVAFNRLINNWGGGGGGSGSNVNRLTFLSNVEILMYSKSLA